MTGVTDGAVLGDITLAAAIPLFVARLENEALLQAASVGATFHPHASVQPGDSLSCPGALTCWGVSGSMTFDLAGERILFCLRGVMHRGNRVAAQWRECGDVLPRRLEPSGDSWSRWGC